jgi:hypothetical protein
MSEKSVSDDPEPSRAAFATFDELERKTRHLEDSLLRLKDEGDNSPQSRNEMMAHNEVLWELGAFAEEAERSGKADHPVKHGESEMWTEERQRGFLIRARKDSLIAQMNSRDALAILVRQETQISAMAKKQRLMETLLGVSVGVIVAMAIKQFWW